MYRSSKHAEVEIFTIGNRILGTQGHPEYNKQWGANVLYKQWSESGDFKEFSESIYKSHYPDEITQEDLLNILFNFLKTPIE